MKKFLKVLLVIVLIIGVLWGGYTISEKYKAHQADQEINSAFKKSGIATNQMIVIQKTGRELWLSGYTDYHKIITTQKDYEFWKQEVQKRGKLLSGKSFDGSFLKDPKNCELRYSVDYYSKSDDKKFNTGHLAIYLMLDENLKIKKEFFAYRPDKLYPAYPEDSEGVSS